MGDKVLTFDYSDIQPYTFNSSAAISSDSSSCLTYKADYLTTKVNTSTDWNTSITTDEFWPNYTFQNYFTYNKSDVEKEITDEINRLLCEGLEHKYFIKTTPKDRLKIKKVKINKCYLINF